jgi:hypothetical protein
MLADVDLRRGDAAVAVVRAHHADARARRDGALRLEAAPARVNRVLDVTWIVTVLPLAVLAVIVCPLTLETVSISHWPCAPGALVKDTWPDGAFPGSAKYQWEYDVLPEVTPAAWAVPK